MKATFIFMGIFIFLVFMNVSQVETAAIICSESKSIVEEKVHRVITNNSTEDYDIIHNNREGNKVSLNKLFHNIQCTLEKAKPWVAELQQEAKRLEEAAKLLGLGILNSFGEFVDKLVEESNETPNQVQTNFTTLSEEDHANSTNSANEGISQYLCPEGFIADHNGICERVD